MNSALKRDENSGAVVNTDVAALNKYKQERALHRKIERLTNECDEVKQCLENISNRLETIEKKINV
jgi:hypothetical protein